MQRESYFSHEMAIIFASPHLVYGLEQRQRNPIRFLLSLKSRLEAVKDQDRNLDGSRCSPLMIADDTGPRDDFSGVLLISCT